MTASLAGLDDDMLDVPVGLDAQEGGDFSSWFPDGLDDSLPQDCDFSGVLEVPDDDLTQLGPFLDIHITVPNSTTRYQFQRKHQKDH
ncbi:hypothetical protein ZWY2020_055081 [Hordeum vulgare]|nr:hypothetical protein ZWY2020_055081 [Hordeum vulgare]